MDPTSHPSYDLPADRPGVLTFRVRFPEGERATLHLVGDLDRDNAADLASVLGALHAIGVNRIEVDAREVTFADCGCVDVLEAHALACAQRGGRLIVVRPSPPVARILELTGTTELFGLDA